MSCGVEKLQQKFNTAKLILELSSIYNKNESIGRSFNAYLQLALTHSVDAIKPWFDGVGSLYDDKTHQLIPTSKFTILNKELECSYLAEVINQVKSQASADGVNIGRVRLMRLDPRTCYTLHRDPEEFRYHIPIKTNEKCIFIIGDKVERMPDVGCLYKFNTKEEHTAVNGSREQRLHLVFDTYK